MTGGGRRCAPTQPSDCNRQVNQTYDFELYSPSRFGNLGRPVYKPEYWDKVQQLDMWTNKYDPVMTCQPLGVPREGPPRRIYQTDKDVTFIYLGGDAGGGYGEYRVIPTDGRKHDPNRARDHVPRLHRGPVGRRHARARLHQVHRYDVVRARRILPLRTTCTSSSDSRARATRCCTTSRSRTPRCSWSRGCFRRAWCGATRIPTRASCRERGNCEVYENDAISSQIRH